LSVTAEAVLFDLALCGLQLRSQLAMPELQPSAVSAPEITLSLASVPDKIPDIVVETPFLQIGACGAFRLEVPTVATYLVRDARDIVIVPHVDAPTVAIRAFLFGPVLGHLATQRGLIALRASAVRIGEQAIVFAGESRRGKSTLAAALALRGHHVLADDICVIDASNAQLRPLSGHVRLWRDSAEVLGFPLGEPCRAGQEKYGFALPSVPAGSAPLPVSAIYIMRMGTQPSVATFDGDAAAHLAAHAYSRTFAAALCGGRAPAAAIPATVPIRQISQRFVFDDLNDYVGELEARHAS
jgi:hypothetical protein